MLDEKTTLSFTNPVNAAIRSSVAMIVYVLEKLNVKRRVSSEKVHTNPEYAASSALTLVWMAAAKVDPV